MNRILLAFALAWLAAGCNQQTSQPSNVSGAPANVAPTTASNHAADDEPRGGAHAVASDADLDVSSPATLPPGDDHSAATDEEMADDDSRSDRTAASDAEVSSSDLDAPRTATGAPDSEAGGTKTAAARKNSAGKLLRGLGNSISRAVAKSYSQRAVVPPPPEDDPFPNGEPEDADPDLNR